MYKLYKPFPSLMLATAYGCELVGLPDTVTTFMMIIAYFVMAAKNIYEIIFAD